MLELKKVKHINFLTEPVQNTSLEKKTFSRKVDSIIFGSAVINSSSS